MRQSFLDTIDRDTFATVVVDGITLTFEPCDVEPFDEVDDRPIDPTTPTDVLEG